MDNLFELLFPIIFIVGSILLNLRKKDDKSKEEASEAGPGQQPVEVDLTDLKEEIRQRIQGRNPVPRQDQESVLPPVQAESVERSRQMHARDSESAQNEKRLNQMRNQVAELRVQADREKKKAASLLKRQSNVTGHPSKKSARTTRQSVKEVIRELRHPLSARKAILNAEILGTPIGLRKQGKIKPSWDI